MDAMIAEAAEASGLQPEKVRTLLGILMGFLRDCCKPASMDKLARQVPELAALAPAKKSGGFFGAMLGSAGALMQLPGKLDAAGIDRDQAKQAMPVVMAYLRGKVDRGTWREVEQQLPAPLRGKA